MSTDTPVLVGALEETTDPEPTAVPAELTGGWLVGAWCLVAGALLLAVGGFVNSFSAVERALRPSFGELAWTIPVLIDCGIAVFAGIDLLFTRLDMRIWWLRLIPWSLNGATIWLNVAHETDSVGVVAHAAAPILWIVTVELAGHFLRARAGLHHPQARRSRGRLDRIRFTRWLLAPWSTLVIRRWMILQDERSFAAAHARWWARKQAKWQLQGTYGLWAWRLRAPRELRGRYRYGYLDDLHTGLDSGATPLDAQHQPGLAGHDDPPDTPPSPSTEPAESQEPDRPVQVRVRPASHRRRPSTGGPRRRRADLDDVRRVVRQLEDRDQPVNRTVVTQLLRAQGLSVSNQRADDLLQDLANAGEDEQNRSAA